MRGWACAILALALLVPIGVVAAEREEHIAVKGIGVVEQKADYVFVSGELAHTAPDVEQAAERVANDIEKIGEALTELGLKPTALAVLDFRTEPEYETQRSAGQRKQLLVGYTTTQSLKIRVEDLAKTGEVLGILAAYNTRTSGDSLEYHVNEPGRLLTKAQDEAMENAIAKAQAFAQAAGRRLGPALIIEESNLSNYRLVNDLRAEVSHEGDDVGVMNNRIVVTGSRIVPITSRKVTTGAALYVRFALE